MARKKKTEQWDVSEISKTLVQYALNARQAAEAQFQNTLRQCASNDGAPDNVDIEFSPDGKSWQVKVAPQGPTLRDM
jgi:hypothetical protein